MADEPNGADLGIDAFGVKANVKNVKSLNTILTLFVAVNVAVMAVFLYAHSVEAKDSAKEIAKELKEANKEVATVLRDSNKELGNILKELSQGIREQNCITVRVQPGMTPQQRSEEAQFCKRISR